MPGAGQGPPGFAFGPPDRGAAPPVPPPVLHARFTQSAHSSLGAHSSTKLLVAASDG